MSKTQSIWLVPRFQFIALGTFFQIFCQSLYVIALPLIVYEMTGSVAAMSIMAVFETLPQLLLGPFMGTLVDRMSRRWVILIGFFVQSMLLLMIPLFNEVGILKTWHLYIIGMLAMLVQGMVRNAQFAVVPLLFPDRKLEANAATSAVWTATLMFGGPISGTLIAFMHPIPAILINSGFLLLAMLTQILVRIPNQKLAGVHSVQQIMKDTKDGFSYILQRKVLVSLILVFAISNLADNGLTPVLLYHLKHNLNLSDSLVGITMGTAGLGLFLGSLIAGKLGKYSAGKVIFWFLIINNIGVSLFLMYGWWWILAAQLFFNIGGVVANVTKSVVIQSIVPDEFMGRAGGTMRLLDTGTQPLSLMILGWMTATHGTTAAFLTVVVLTLLSTVVMFASSVQKINLAPQSEVSLGQ